MTSDFERDNFQAGPYGSSGPSIDTREGLLWLLSARCAQAQLILALLEDEAEDGRERRAFEALRISCVEIASLCRERDWANEDGE